MDSQVFSVRINNPALLAALAQHLEQNPHARVSHILTDALSIYFFGETDVVPSSSVIASPTTRQAPQVAQDQQQLEEALIRLVTRLLSHVGVTQDEIGATAQEAGLSPEAIASLQRMFNGG